MNQSPTTVEVANEYRRRVLDQEKRMMVSVSSPNTPAKAEAKIASHKQSRYPGYVENYPKQAGVNHLKAFFDSWSVKCANS